MLLRDVTEDDLPLLFEHQRDPEATRMAAMKPRDHDAFYAHWRTNILGNPNVIKKAIIADGEVVGNIGCFDIHGRRSVGYMIARAHWGRGIASAALREVVTHHEAVRPLYADVAVENTASRRVLEKCGFVVTGPAVTGDDGIAELLMRLG